MATKSVYLAEPVVEGDCIRITGDEHHHLAVARAEKGEVVEVFDGRGQVWSTEVASSGRRETLVRILETWRVEQSGIELILGLSLVKPAAFELALEKAVEVGVTRIVPIMASRSNVEPGRRQDRWKRIVIGAAKQSKRYHLPQVDPPVPFARTLDFEAKTKIVFAERGGGPLKSALAGSPVLFLVGPEGGWIDAELEASSRKGFRLVGLGEGILRSETAAIVGAALIRYELCQTL